MPKVDPEADRVWAEMRDTIREVIQDNPDIGISEKLANYLWVKFDITPFKHTETWEGRGRVISTPTPFGTFQTLQLPNQCIQHIYIPGPGDYTADIVELSTHVPGTDMLKTHRTELKRFLEDW